MSHQTGIRANGDLLEAFDEAKYSNRIRCMKVVIDSEQMVLERKDAVRGTWETDWSSSLPQWLDDKTPCYILYRLDVGWLLLNYAPDSAAIRSKMLVAGTRATLKNEFGVQYIAKERHITSKCDATLDAYKSSERAGTPPMSVVEAHLNSVKLEERAAADRAAAAKSLSRQAMRGLAFPVDQDAQTQLAALAEGTVNYVQLSVDTLNEAIKLERSATIELDELPQQVTRSKPRYHFYRSVDARPDGELVATVVFLYTLPEQAACTIKERMLYSSCKAPFLETVDRFLGVRPDKKLELDARDDIVEAVQRELCPAEQRLAAYGSSNSLSQMQFSKPKPPAGARRLVKPARQ